MDDITDRPLKELFAAVYHDQLKEPSPNFRGDHEKVLNELLDQPAEFKNSITLMNDGLEVDTLKEHIQYIHTKDLDSRVLKRKSKSNIRTSSGNF